MEDGVAMPDDVLIEILVNLLVKSLMRFKCVSKYWCALIKSPNFVSRHLKRDCNEIVLMRRRLPQPSQGTRGDGGRVVLSFHDPDSLDLLVSPNLPIPQFLDNLVGNGFFGYMGTCNGLACLAFSETVVLCNPALREFEILPPSPFGIPERYIRRVLAMGFGFDATTDAYKIVRFASILSTDEDYPEDVDDVWVRIDLYNSSTNSWRLIDAVVPHIMDYSGFNIFFNGACHWLSYRSRGYSIGILSLDLSIEVFRHFELPDFEEEKFAALGVVNQCLALIRLGFLPCDRPFVDIWVMKEYGVKESWAKEFVIGPYPFGYSLLLLKNEWLLMVTMNYRLVSCALHGDEIKDLHFEDKEWSTRAENFKESLISLKKVILCGKED